MPKNRDPRGRSSQVILLREVHAGSSCSFKSGRKFTSSGGEVHVFRKFSQGSSRTEAARFEVIHSVRKFSEGVRQEERNSGAKEVVRRSYEASKLDWCIRVKSVQAGEER